MDQWPPVVDGVTTYDLAHLDAFVIDAVIDEVEVAIRVEFSAHVFSDEKAKGALITLLTNEKRYFCKTRYSDSFDVAHFMQTKFVESHVRAHLNRKKKQQFYTTDAGHLAVFMTIQKSADRANEIKCRVVSAYEPTALTSLPKGKLYTVRTVCRRRLAGEEIKVR